MRRIISTLIFFFMLMPTAFAEDVIGLSLPITGRFSPVAEQVEFGARLALEQLNSKGSDLQIELVDDGCNPKTAGQSANKFLKAGAKIVVGPLCFKLAIELVKALNTSGDETPTIPVIAINTRNNLLKRLRDVEELPLYSLSSSFTDEAQAVVNYILPQFEGKPFAVIDDGSVHGRSLAENVRLLGEQAGFKPIITTDFRPLQSSQVAVLRRLQKSGVEAVFIAAGATDLVTISRGLKKLKYNWLLAAGEQAELLPFTGENKEVPYGLLMVREKSPEANNATAINKILKGNLEPNVLLGYSLIQIAAQAIKRDSTELRKLPFSTVFGKLSFNEEGRASPLPFGLFRWNGKSFSPVLEN